jgi:hypothetical protein
MANAIIVLQPQDGSFRAVLGEPGRSDVVTQKYVLGDRMGGAADSPTADLSVLFKQVAHDRKIKVPKSVLILLHRQDYAILHLELPDGTQEEITSMVRLELSEKLPLDEKGICFGWIPVGQSERGLTHIEVYWAPLAEIQPVFDSLKKEHFQVIGIIPSVLACRYLVQDMSSDPLIVLRASETEFELFYWGTGGGVHFSRGKRLPSAPEGTLSSDSASIGSEIECGLKVLLEKYPESGSVPLFYIGPDDFRVLISSLHGNLQTQEKFSSFCKKLLTGRSFSDLPQIASLCSSTALDLSQKRHGTVTVDMFPVSLRSIREAWFEKKLVLQTLLSLMAVILLLIGNIWYFISYSEREYQDNKAKIKSIAPQVQEVEIMTGQLGLIRAQTEYVLAPIDALREINTVLAQNDNVLDGLFLDNFVYNAEGTINLEGHARNDITPLNFTDILERTGAFKIEKAPQITVRMYGDTRVIRFVIALKATGKKVTSS